MADSDPFIGRTFSHYRIIEKLGAGGMGVVYKAEDLRLNRFLALKFLPDNTSRDSLALERFRREARAASALSHPGICTIYDIGDQDSRAFIAMEFVDGQTLRNYIRGNSLPVAEILKFGVEIADALDAAHQEGIIHRDIKPGNVFVTRRGHAKILDFGLAKLVPKGVAAAGSSGEDDASDSTSVVGIISGTPSYMSPEQVRGDDLDARTDIFSLGLLLYEMATGRRAFPGATGGLIIEAVLTRSPAPVRSLNPEIPPQLEDIIRKAIHKDKDVRYQRAADLSADLRQVQLSGNFGSATQPGSAPFASKADITDSFPAAEQSARAIRDSTGSVRAPRIARVIDSLAVLPLENIAGDPEHEYLSDGISSSLINTLATIPKLRVMAQSTVFRYKHRAIDPQTVGRELNVRAVLTGRITQSGESLRIGTELVDVATGTQLWGAQFDRKPGDIFAIQDQISAEISEKLRLKLTRAEKKRLAKRPTRDAEAYRLYLQGRHHWNRWTEDGFYKAIDYFQQAIARDPEYALAYAALADCYVLLGWNSYLLPRDAFPKGKAAAERALQLDPDLGEAHAPLAAVLWLYDWHWREAESEFESSMALNPSYPTSSHWYAEFLMTVGRHDDALARMRKSQDLDPLSLIISVAIGWALYMGRRYDDAVTQLRRTLDMEPNYPVTHWILGLALRKLLQHDAAIAAGEKAVKLSGGSPLMNAAFAQSLGTAHHKEEATAILEELTQLAAQKYISSYFFAGIHAGLGDAESALQCLEKSFEEHSHWLIYLHLDPAMDALRSLPRFQDLLQRIGLPLADAASGRN